VTVPGGGFVGDALSSLPMVFFSDEPYDFLLLSPALESVFGSTLKTVRRPVASESWDCWCSFRLANDPADRALLLETELSAVE